MHDLAIREEPEEPDHSYFCRIAHSSRSKVLARRIRSSRSNVMKPLAATLALLAS